MIAVLGLGFIGLTVALGFAEHGEKVYGVDIDEFRVDLIRRGKIPYYEPGLDEALERHLNHNFSVVDDIDDLPDGIDCFFICCGTPNLKNGKQEHTNTKRAISDILDAGFEGYFTIAIKTSLLPGTMDEQIVPYIESQGVKIGEDLGVVFCPEFIREGKCWHDFTHPSRVVIGLSNEKDLSIISKYYQSFDAPIMAVSYKTAEFIRYMTSTLLATMISYSNEMAQAAKVMGGINIPEAFRIMQTDSRWFDNTMRGYVYPGCGFGGVALPQDTSDFVKIAKDQGADMSLLESVLHINDTLPSKVCSEISAKTSKDEKLGILGLTFKEGSGDVRNSASAKIIDNLLKMGYKKIYAYDPIANDDYATVYKQKIHYCFSVREICDICDVVIIATPWRQFKVVKDYAKNKKVIDCRYMLKDCNENSAIA